MKILEKSTNVCMHKCNMRDIAENIISFQISERARKKSSKTAEKKYILPARMKK